MENKTQLHLIIEAKNAVCNLNSEDLNRISAYGEAFNFRDLVPYLNVTQSFFTDVDEDLLFGISNSVWDRYGVDLEAFLNNFMLAANFDSSRENAVNERRSLIDGTVSSFFELIGFFEAISSLVSLTDSGSFSNNAKNFRNALEIYQGDIEKVILKVTEKESYISKKISELDLKIDDRAEKNAKEVGQIVENYLITERGKIEKAYEEFNSELNKMIEASRKSVGKIAVSREAKHFDGEVEEYALLSRIWLSCTIISVLIFVVFAIPGFFEWVVSVTSPSTFAALNSIESESKGILGVPLTYLLSKIVTLGALSFVVGICAKNFVSNRHNTVLNRHRSKALMTFEALAQSAFTDTSRDVILHHAANCIFNPQDTGFGRVGESSPSINIVESAKRSIDLTNSSGSGS